MPSDIVIHASPRARLLVLLFWLLIGALLIATPVQGHLLVVLAWTVTLWHGWQTTPGLGGPVLRLRQEKKGWSLQCAEDVSRSLLALRPLWVSAGLVSVGLTTPAGRVVLVVPADATDPGAHRRLRRLLTEGLPQRERDQSVAVRGT